MNKESWGATIERGMIVQAENGLYTVKSLSRENVTSLPMQDTNGHTYAVGDMVCFFMFDDGTGAILAGLQKG